MANQPKILVFAGSLRRDSYNKKLALFAARAAEHAGAEVTYVDLLDYPMPLLNQDDEAASGLPETAKAFKQLMIEHDGFLIASPEYNSSVSAVLKNTLDWASRAENRDEPALQAFNGKIVGLMSASPGALGGMRGLVHLRAIMSNLSCLVIPEQKAVSQAHKAFSEDGELLDEQVAAAVERIAERLTEILVKLNG